MWRGRDGWRTEAHVSTPKTLCGASESLRRLTYPPHLLNTPLGDNEGKGRRLVGQGAS